MKVFRDPVHEDIFIPLELVDLIDTAQMQRLRGIKQLGTASLVYPGAVHTRFEHSLGTCHLAIRLLSILEEFGTKVSKAEKLAVSAAALLHDIGHIPFGHTVEDERRVFSRHDSIERFEAFFNKRTELGKALRKLNIGEQVQNILYGTAEKAWLSELISGVFCADLLDYLARDAFFCGLSQKYDKRILRSLRSGCGHLYLDCQKNGVVREDLVSEVINLLRLRYFLTERVFFHHTKTASGAMISRIIERALELGLELKDILPLGDERLLAFIEWRFGSDQLIASIIKALQARKIYKRAYVLTRRIGTEKEAALIEQFHHNATWRRQAEDELIGDLGLQAGELIIYCPSAKMQLKEAEVLVKIDEEEPRSLASLNLPEVSVLRDKHRNLWRFYVFVSQKRQYKLRQISSACERYFGLTNHLPTLQSAQLYMSF
ncbi:MAG: HD domain-containing protein [Candidatus Bruticola sp.]